MAQAPKARESRGLIEAQRPLQWAAEGSQDAFARPQVPWGPKVTGARGIHDFIWAMVNTHYMVDGHPIHNKDPYNGYYKSLWTIGWLAPINGY